MPAADDHAVGPLVLARLISLGRRAPRRHRMPATIRATAVRVIDRVHGDAAYRRPDAAPTLSAGFSDGAQAVLFVSDGTDGRPAIDVHLADLARMHADLRVRTLTRQELYGRARRARDLRAVPGEHFDAVDRRADRDAPQRETVAGFDRRVGPAHELRAGRNPAGRDDVTALAVGVQQQREVRAAVRIVFEPLDLGSNAVLVATEIDEAVMTLVPAALMPHRDAAEVVPAGAALLAFDELLERPALVQIAVDDLDQRAAARRCRLDFDECHGYASCAKLISWPGFRQTYAFFQLRRRPEYAPKRLALPWTLTIWTLSTSTFLSFQTSSTAALTSFLVASGRTRKMTWLCLSATNVAFSETTGARSTVMRRPSFTPDPAADFAAVFGALIPGSPRTASAPPWSAAHSGIAPG